MTSRQVPVIVGSACGPTIVRACKLIAPAVIATALADWVAIVPRPKFVRAVSAVVAPVPPWATVTAVAFSAAVVTWAGVALLVVAPPPVTNGKTSDAAVMEVAAGNAVIFTSAMFYPEMICLSSCAESKLPSCARMCAMAPGSFP